MSTKHGRKLDDEKLEFACELIRKLWGKRQEYTACGFVEDVLMVLEFGNVSNQDLRDYMEATGEQFKAIHKTSD